MTTEPTEHDHDDEDSRSGISKAAELHSAELLEFGLTVDQVVHRYGDVCQSVTELSTEQNLTIATDKFRILNRCLDNAIASAVASFGQERQLLVDGETKSLYENLKAICTERRRLVDMSIQSFAPIKAGTVGAGGATAILLAHVLEELRSLDDCAVFYPRGMPNRNQSPYK